MILSDASQMKAADHAAIREYGIPGVVLMECAAEEAMAEICREFGSPSGRRIVVLCGSGSNGGDGYALARKLWLRGAAVMVYSVCNPNGLEGDTRINFSICEKLGIPVCWEASPEGIAESLSNASLVVDALLGTGMKHAPREPIASWIQIANACGKPIVSLDLPSGLEADEGVPPGDCILATLTVCFGRGKTGLFSEPGCSFAGKVSVCDIGIPPQAYPPANSFAYDEDLALSQTIPRASLSSKGDYGKVLIIAGSPGMTGAMSLCAEACIRSGAGVVYILAPRSRLFQYDRAIREAVVLPAEDHGAGYVSADACRDILEACEGKDAVIIGPGLSRNSRSHEIVSCLLRETSLPVVADAQTLNDLAVCREILKRGSGRMVLTPHPGEMARLCGTDIGHIQARRISSAKSFARQYGVVVLLKGHRTVTTNGETVYLNTTGNPGMATGGSGDVLAGMIGAHVAMGRELLSGTAFCAYLHGKAGNLAAEKFGMTGLKAGDIIKNIMIAEKTLHEKNARQSVGGDQPGLHPPQLS